MRPRPLARPSRAGFTLVELLAVLSVLGIIAATAIPSLSNLSRQRRQAGVQLAVRDFSYARELALTNTLGTWLVFSVFAQQYSVLSDNRATPGRTNAATVTDPATGSPYIQRLNTGELTGLSLVSVSIPGGGNDVGFDRLGRPISPTGSLLQTDCTITFSSNNAVTIRARTGQVTRAITSGGG